MWTFLKSLLNLLQHCFCIMFFGHKSRGISASQRGIPGFPYLLHRKAKSEPPGNQKSLEVVFKPLTCTKVIQKKRERERPWCGSETAHSPLRKIIPCFQSCVDPQQISDLSSTLFFNQVSVFKGYQKPLSENPDKLLRSCSADFLNVRFQAWSKFKHSHWNLWSGQRKWNGEQRFKNGNLETALCTTATLSS